MFTFKQFLTELMVDVDPEQDASDQLIKVRQAQLMAKRSPERVTKGQLQQAQQQKVAAAQSTDATSGIKMQIAKKKEELFKLQQKLDKMVKQQQANAPKPVPGQEQQGEM